jgi:hypothetical protein
MPRQLTMHRRLAWSGALALAAALAVLLVPGVGSTVSAEGALLALAALAALSGHRWGNVVILATHVPLAGRLFTLATENPRSSVASHLALSLVLMTLVPTVLWSVQLVPQLVREMWPQAPRRLRRIGVVAILSLLLVSLVAPAVGQGVRQARANAPRVPDVVAVR